MVKISLIKCDDYNSAYNAVNEAISLLGGISHFVKKGDRVLLKPNLLSVKPPERAVTTHPEIVRAVIRLVKSAGGIPVVGDSPGGVRPDIKKLWEVTGMLRVCREEQAELVGFEAAGSSDIDINNENIKKLTVSKAVLDCDVIINLPKFKTHSLMTFTAGVKNLYGCVPGLRKVEYHKYASKNEEFAKLLSDIYLFLKDKISLTIIDGILGMEGNGPSAGTVRKMNMIAASCDIALLDAFLLDLAGGNLSKNHVLKALNISKNDLNSVKLEGNSPQDFDFKDFKFPQTRKLDFVPKPIVKLCGRFLWVKPKINRSKCVGCMFCGESCPVKAIERKNGEKYPRVNREKCISCFCCHELCPHKAIDFQKSLLAKFFL